MHIIIQQLEKILQILPVPTFQTSRKNADKYSNYAILS